jgi:hypothetical protein
MRVATRWRWPIVALLVVGLVLAAVMAWRACALVERFSNAPGGAARAVGEIAERFHSGRITTTFLADIPRLLPGGPLLEVGAFEATETFTRTDERSVLFDLIPLGTNVTEIRVGVTYRYHLRLEDPWRLDVRGPVCLVEAPALRPSLPPAVHTDRMERRSERGWLRFDVESQMAELERSITPTLNARAADRAHIALVRDPCRRRTAELVRTWLLREDHWRDGRFTAVTVTFADEHVTDVAGHPPTLTKD